MSENQTKYDELDAIIDGIDKILYDITTSNSKYYIDYLNDLKYEAMTERDEIGEQLLEEQEREEKEMNYQYERSRI